MKKPRKQIIRIIGVGLLAAALSVPALAAGADAASVSSTGGTSTVKVTLSAANSDLSSGNFLVKKNGNNVGVINAQSSDGKTYTLTVNQPFETGDDYTVSLNGADNAAGEVIAKGTVGARASASPTASTTAAPTASTTVVGNTAPMAVATATAASQASVAGVQAAQATATASASASPGPSASPTQTADFNLNGKWEPEDGWFTLIINGTSGQSYSGGREDRAVDFTINPVPGTNKYFAKEVTFFKNVDDIYLEPISADQVKATCTTTWSFNEDLSPVGKTYTYILNRVG